MESIFVATNQQQQLLAPYLAGLNVSEALEDFGRLADLVLATPCCSPPPPGDDDLALTDSPAPSSGGGGPYVGYSSDSNSPGGDTCRFYPASGGIPTPASSQWLSQPPSPTVSHSGSSIISCSGASCYSSSTSSSSSPHQRRRSRENGSSGGSDGGGRKRQNATAAERYRRRVKGHKSGLEEELERERERHSRLLAGLESKMLLYSEFARLLAANTRDPTCDSGLARVGSRSLATVLECVAPLGLLGELERGELEHLLEHFRRLSAAAAAAPSVGLDQPTSQYQFC